MIASARQIGDDAAVPDVEMPAIDAAGLERLDDVAGVLGRAGRRIERLGRVFEEPGNRSRTSCGVSVKWRR